MAIATTQQPKIFYQPPQDPGAPPELAPIAGLSGPPSGPPPVFANAPAMPAAAVSPIKTQIDATNHRLLADQWKDANPYGSANNHPGIGGKILHALSVAGNITGDIFAPSEMALMGDRTELGRRVEEGGLSRRLQDLQQTESEDEARDATTGKTKEETSEMPGAAEDKHQESSALTRKTNDEANALKNPPAEWQPITGMIGQNGQPIEVNKRTGEYRYGGITGATQLKPPRPDSPEQQYIDEYQKTHPGSSVAAAERAYTLDTQRPPQIAPVMMMVPNSTGGATATVVHPGQSVAPGAETASQFGGGNAADVKADKARAQAHQQAQQDFQLAETLASHPSPTNDLALVMHYIGATKPDSLGKLRLNQNEISLVMSTRSGLGDIQALIQKAQNGQMLTPQQRTDMINTMKLLAQSGEQSGGGAGAEGGAQKTFSLQQAMGLSFNKGKSEADVRKDLEAHGYQVTK